MDKETTSLNLGTAFWFVSDTRASARAQCTNQESLVYLIRAGLLNLLKPVKLATHTPRVSPFPARACTLAAFPAFTATPGTTQMDHVYQIQQATTDPTNINHPTHG